jgi:hypothetical protein
MAAIDNTGAELSEEIMEEGSRWVDEDIRALAAEAEPSETWHRTRHP